MLRRIALLTAGLAAATNAVAATAAPVRRAPGSPRVVARVAPLLTLGDAQRIALANVPDIRAVRFDLDAAQEGIRIAHSAYEPQAYGQAVQAFNGPGTRISAYNGINDPTVIQRTAVGVGVRQYITDFGRTTLLVQASEADLRTQASLGAQTRDVVLLNVTQAYFEALRSQALTTVAIQTVRERQTLVRQASALQRAGLRSMLDVSVAERDRGTAQQTLLAARAQERSAYSNLSTALGFNSLHLYRLRDIAGLPPVATLTPLIDAALRDSPDLALAQNQGLVANLRAAVASRAAYPTLDAYGFFGVTPIRARNQPINPSYSTVGLAFNVPIFTGGAIGAEQRQARDLARSAETNVVAQENRLLRNVRDAYNTVEAARGNIALSRQVLATARDAFRYTQARYQVGLSSIVDLSEAQLSEQQAAIDGTNATYDYIVQAASLEYVTGMLSGSELFPGNVGPQSVVPSRFGPGGGMRGGAAASSPAAATGTRRHGMFGGLFGRTATAQPAAPTSQTAP